MKTNWPAFRCGCLIVASVVLGGSLANVRGQEPSGATSTAAVISSVAITQEPQRAAIRVEGAARLELHTSRMQNPERLVLDFNGARLGVQRTVIPGVSAPVRGVRIGQFRPDVARVVVDLTGETPYQITHEGDALVVYFQMQLTPDASAVAPVTSTSNESTKKSIEYAANSPKTAAHRTNASNTVAPRFSLPKELTQPSLVLASLNEKSAPARPDGGSQQASQLAVQQATSAATTVAAQQTPTSNAPQAGHYTGEPISVNLKDVDLKDFFRLIHEISGLNVVLDPNVKGTLTIVLDEVPWDQALDIVLQNNNLDKQLTGNVLRVATRETLKREAESARDLEKAQAEAVAPVTVTRVLSYAKAATMKDTLKKFLSARGDILSDDRSNQLIVRDIPSVIPTIDNLIRQLDRKSQQVEIEARVVSASRTFAQDIGVQWGFAGTTTGGRSIFGGPANVGVSPVTTGAGIPQPPLVGTPPSGSSSTLPGLPFNVNLGAGVPTSGFYFGHRSPNFAVDLFITAAESKGVGKLLSKPKVITQNNEKAIVKQGTKIPIQTVINNTISVQYIDAVLQLEVTPQITAEGTVFMDVLVENTQIDNGIPRVQGIPALDTQAAQTKVTVADGGTVVIGGIIVTQQQTNITEVPIVGSLPIIGYLFRRTNVSVTSQELLFFITPRIIPG
ncbi:MAG TPA: type IV pilus secretin PilQ [Candidatus Baltobacteraceae bacterium]|nr:type IV pilus secretin PilQ [Candidatus Baltobacteraceae bacterium]